MTLSFNIDVSTNDQQSFFSFKYSKIQATNQIRVCQSGIPAERLNQNLNSIKIKKNLKIKKMLSFLARFYYT